MRTSKALRGVVVAGCMAMALVLVMASGAVAAGGSKGEKGPTGPTGPAGERGEKGLTGEKGLQGEKGATGPTGPPGPTGPTGPTPPAGTEKPATSFGFLANGAEERGKWSASMSLPTGAPQEQADGEVTFPLAYPEEPAKLKIKVENEVEGFAPKAPCLGEINNPSVSEPGWLCIYTAFLEPKEAAEKGAKYAGVESPNSQEVIRGTEKTGECNTEEDNCRLGVRVVFRTNKWNFEGTQTTSEPTLLDEAGSWAVKAN